MVVKQKKKKEKEDNIKLVIKATFTIIDFDIDKNQKKYCLFYKKFIVSKL